MTGRRESVRETDRRERVALAEIAVPVPRMLVRRQSKSPTHLYRIEVGEALYLVAETEHGYFGCALICPHRGTRLDVSGKVYAGVPAILCQAHAIAYSLIDGGCLENSDAEHEEPGLLPTFSVRREGDMFMVIL